MSQSVQAANGFCAPESDLDLVQRETILNLFNINLRCHRKHRELFSKNCGMSKLMPEWFLESGKNHGSPNLAKYILTGYLKKIKR